MGLESVHPLYAEHQPDWEQLRDAAKGERAVKAKGQKYLPPTSGMILDGLNGGVGGAAYNPAGGNGGGWSSDFSRLRVACSTSLASHVSFDVTSPRNHLEPMRLQHLDAQRLWSARGNRRFCWHWNRG